MMPLWGCYCPLLTLVALCLPPCLWWGMGPPTCPLHSSLSLLSLPPNMPAHLPLGLCTHGFCTAWNTLPALLHPLVKFSWPALPTLEWGEPALCFPRLQHSTLPCPSLSPELVMSSNCLILCHPLLLPSIFCSIRVFSNESALPIR